MRKAEEMQTSYCMHDGLQLQRAGKALFLLQREPESSVCVGVQMFHNSFGLHCSSPLAEEGNGQFLTDLWDRGLCLILAWLLFIMC